MAAKLCLLCCENFRPEVEAAIAAEGWSEVVLTAFPSRCGLPPLGWDELRPLLAADCAQVEILGRACLQGLAEPPEGWPPVRLLPQAECFHLVAGKTMVEEAMTRGAYLLTPAWLADWRGRLAAMGFDDEGAAAFFQEFARELVLLDTGVRPDAPAKLAEMAEAMRLPAARIAVGIDYTRLVLARVVDRWRLEELSRQAQVRERERAREIADQLSAMDFVARLAALKDEEETIAAIEELFQMLFAPQELHYLRLEEGTPPGLDGLAPELARQMRELDRDWAWTGSRDGFLLRISRGGQALGIVVAERFAFPDYRERYLNLALSVADICGLAIANARIYRRTREAEAALRKSEQSLKMAQAIGHLGHWEWELASGEMRWSDETYRILGYLPQALVPSRNAFMQAIHADDRAKVAEAIERALAGRGFDLEYRIVLPQGMVRVVHGTLQAVAAPARGAVLGIIQDITECKELEWKLAQEARTDALTGCANRRHFLELARQEVGRVRRYGGELSVLMLDLDHFKAVNDRHGHHVGDLVLQKVVQLCRATLREEDVVGRLGGEEFAVVLPQTGFERAREAAERVRQALEGAELPLAGQPALRFTASLGVASLAPGDAGVDALLDRADLALYEAKEAGRNTVRP